MLLLAVALLIFAACAAFANHVTCSYKPGNDSPYAYDYIRFCIAARGTNKTGDTEFRCQPGEFASGTPLVATWNVLGQGILEMGECLRGRGVSGADPARRSHSVWRLWVWQG